MTKREKLLLSIIVPVYNEKESVEKVLTELADALGGLEHELIVVDDASSDGTSGILKRIRGISLIAHSDNEGYGASIKDGLMVARGELIGIIDADGTYPPDMIPEMVGQIKTHHMVVGARKPLPPFNQMAKSILKLLVWLLTRKRVPDINSGLRVFKKEVADRFLHLLPEGYSFTTTLTIACLVNHYEIGYIPISYYRRKGFSKIRPVREFFNFIILILRLVMYFKPLEVVLPVSLILFLAGVSIGIYSLAVYHRVMDVTMVVLILAAIQIAFLGLLADIIIRRR